MTINKDNDDIAHDYNDNNDDTDGNNNNNDGKILNGIKSKNNNNPISKNQQ